MKNQVQTFPLPAARLESCRIAGGKLAMATDEVVPVQPGVIVTGADAAAFLIFSEASRSRTGTEGKLEINQTYSGGEASDYTWHVSEDGFAALDHLEYGSFPVWAPEASPCHIWLEVRIPKRGNWNFHASLNNAPAAEQMIQGAEPQKWFWFRLTGDFCLKADYNQFDLSMVLGGKQIRRIVFLTDGSDFPPSNLKISRRACNSACFYSETLNWNNVFLPLALELPYFTEGTTDQVRFFAVYNNRKQQLPVTEKDHRLYCALDSFFAASDIPDGKVFFIIELHRYGKQPVFGLPQLLCREMALHRDRFISGGAAVCWDAVRLNFCEGGMVGGSRLLSPWNSLPLFELETSEGQITSGTAECRRVHSDSRGFLLEFRWETLPGILIKTRFSVLDDGLYSLKYSIMNSSRYIFLDSIRTLQFSGLGTEWKNSELLFPKYEPVLVPNPATRGNQEEIYPRGAFCYCDFSNSEEGLFLAAPDAELYLTRFRCVPSVARDSVTLSVEKRHRVRPGKQAVFTFYFALHRGDWHKAAVLYRKIFDAIFPPDVHYPAWAVESNGYYAASLASVEADLPEIQPPPYEKVAQNHVDRAWYLGMEHIQMWGQAAMDHNCPTFYLPDPQRGGEKAFLEMLKLFERYQMRFGSYFHSSAYSPFYAQADWIRGVSRKEILEDGVLLDRRQFLRGLDYRSSDMEAPPPLPEEAMEEIRRGKAVIPRQYPRMSSFSSEFQDYIRYWIRRYVGRYRHSVIYHDQLGNAPQRPEYNSFLGIEGAGDGGSAMLSFLVSLYREFSEGHPDFLQIQEAVTDALARYAMPMTSGFQHNIETYRYTFPEHQVYFGHSNGCWKDRMVYPTLQRAFLEGLKFDILRIQEDAARLVRFRDSLKHFFFHARYTHHDGVRLAAVSGEFRAFYRNSPGEHYLLVTLCNLPEGGTLVLLPEYRACNWRQITFLDENGKLKICSCSPDGEIIVPATRSGVLFLADRLLPGQDFFCSFEPDGKEGNMCLQIMPLLPDCKKTEFQIKHELGELPWEKVSFADGMFRRILCFDSRRNLHLRLSVGSKFALRRLSGSIHGTYYGYPFNRKNLRMHFYEIPEQERRRILNTEY